MSAQHSAHATAAGGRSVEASSMMMSEEECKNNGGGKSKNEDDEEEGGDSSSSPASCWSLSIKPVGVERRRDVGGEWASNNGGDNDASPSSSPSNHSDFVIEVSPDDDLDALYDCIERVTGLRASQQRLIYRGQLLGGGGGGGGNNNKSHSDAHAPNQQGSAASTSEEDSENVQPGGSDAVNKDEAKGAAGEPPKGTESSPGSLMRIKDIRGLSDGHTIHLVKKREQPPGPEDNEPPEAAGGAGGSSPSRRSASSTPRGRGADADAESSVEVLGTPSAAPLLAALLGLGDDASSPAPDATTPSPRRRRSPPSSRLFGVTRSGVPNRRTQHHHRLTAEDLESVPDPGSLESVRQGMLTLHTMLPHALHHASSSSSPSRQLPQQHRQWYVGQWIDCLDTVNQWLEATIIDIATPGDVLPPDEESHGTEGYRRVPPAPFRRGGGEPIVSASDLAGRRHLLVEPCDEEHSELDLGGELAGYKRRSNDDHVQLLLIHYNGWPHRWDEWIRNDSHRIRPFRVRTRHPTASSHLSPTPQSTYAEAPSTRMVSGQDHDDEALDRTALLSELGRVMNSINELVQSAGVGLEELRTPTASRNTTMEDSTEATNESNESHLPWLQGVPSSSSTRAESVAPAQLRTELAALAPLLDRLGRTLVDAAPHVANLSRSELQLAPATATSPQDEAVRSQSSSEEHPTSLGGLLSLLGRDRRRQSNASNNVVVPGDNQSAQGSVQASDVNSGTGGGVDEDEASSVDPDLTDLVFGVVNTTRGEVRRGPRSRQQVSDDAANLLGTYLAAASLGSLVASGGGGDDDDVEGSLQDIGRLIRERGTGGGIDIHIHAVVTSPGALPVGLTTLAAGTGAVNDVGRMVLSSRSPNRGPANRSNETHTPPVVAPDDDDDDGIFSDLYSETPEPVDPGRPPLTNAATESPSPPRPRVVPRSISASSRSSSQRMHTNADRNDETQRTGVQRNPSRRRGNLFSRVFRRNASTE